MLNVIVKRSQWHRGKAGARLLVPETGQMCCLGFVCLAAGYSQADINDMADPEELVERTQLTAATLRGLVIVSDADDEDDTRLDADNTGICNDMVTINDSEDLFDADREDRLSALALKADINMAFED